MSFITNITQTCTWHGKFQLFYFRVKNNVYKLKKISPIKRKCHFTITCYPLGFIFTLFPNIDLILISMTATQWRNSEILVSWLCSKNFVKLTFIWKPHRDYAAQIDFINLFFQVRLFFVFPHCVSSQTSFN